MSIALVLRIFTFTIAFYFLIEYIIASPITTWVGLGIVLVIVVTLTALVTVVRQHTSSSQCERCHQVIQVPFLKGIRQMTNL